MAKSKKHKKEKKSKKKRHREKHKSKKVSKNVDKITNSTIGEKPKIEDTATPPDDNYDIPLDLMCNKSHAPETPEEYQKRQSKLRHEIDPVTGRQRLIRGDGEVLEEIVSRKRHVEINKLATKEDGRFFQANSRKVV